MRLFALLALGVATLVIPAPAAAAPLAETTTVSVPGVAPSGLGLSINAFSDAASTPKLAAATAVSTSNKMEHNHGILRRGTSFREADYGVSPNATVLNLAPVNGVEAAPTSTTSAPTTTHSSRSYRPYDAFSNAEDPVPQAEVPVSQPAPTPADLSSSVSQPTSPASIPGSNSGSGAGDLTHLVTDGYAKLMENRYKASYASHDAMENAMNGTNPVVNGINKATPNTQKTDKAFAHALHHRDIAPGSLLDDVLSKSNGPMDKMTKPHSSQDALSKTSAHNMTPGRHSLELNTDPLAPRPHKNVNTSDSQAMAEERRMNNMGVVNIDSNRAPLPPPPTKLPDQSPLNGTEANLNKAATNTTNAATTKAA